MNSQNERKKAVNKARLGFTALISGAVVILAANIHTIFRNGDHSFAFLLLLLIPLVVIVVLLSVTATGRAQGKRFRAFRAKYPNSYMCQPDLVASSYTYALTRDGSDLVLFVAPKSEYKELLRMPIKNLTITTAEVSPNGVRKFIGLEVISDTDYEARFVLLNDKTSLLRANNSQSYAEEAAKNLAHA